MSQQVHPGEAGALAARRWAQAWTCSPGERRPVGSWWITNCPYLQLQFQAEGNAKLLCPPPPLLLLLEICSELGGQQRALGRQHKLSSHLCKSSTYLKFSSDVEHLAQCDLQSDCPCLQMLTAGSRHKLCKATAEYFCGAKERRTRSDLQHWTYDSSPSLHLLPFPNAIPAGYAISSSKIPHMLLCHSLGHET